jgi:hypothetical protein
MRYVNVKMNKRTGLTHRIYPAIDQYIKVLSQPLLLKIGKGSSLTHV